jgi:tetratricopeptide (TPR) repeat protein
VAVEQAPERSAPRIERGNAYGELGRFANAREDFKRAAEQEPNNAEPRYRTALACIALNDQAGYHRACGELFARFATTDDPKVASPLAYTCVALPGAVEKSDVLVRWGEVATPLFRGNERVLGAALYRAGRYEEAIRKLEDATHLTTPVAWDWLFLAMSHHRLGHTDRARDYLTKAQQWVNLANAKPDSKLGAPRASWHSWNERAEVRALQHEAEALINSGR